MVTIFLFNLRYGPLIQFRQGGFDVVVEVVQLSLDESCLIFRLRVGGCNTGFVSVSGNAGRTITNGRQWRVQSTFCQVLVRHSRCQCFSCQEEDVVFDVMDANGDDSQRNTREDVGIVALTWIIHLSLIVDWHERRSTGEDDFSVSVLVGFDGCAFGFAGWVAESKDDGSFVESGHVFEDFRRESPSDSSSTNENGRLDESDDLVELVHGWNGLGELDLVAGDASVGAVLDQETVGVDQPDFAAGFLMREPVLFHGHHNQAIPNEASPA